MAPIITYISSLSPSATPSSPPLPLSSPGSTVPMLATLLISSLTATAATAATSSNPPSCPPNLLSCSPAAVGADPCCVPSAGLVVFRQRFQPDVGGDVGSWGIDQVDILECDGSPAYKAFGPKLTHEQIGTQCESSGIIDVDEAERAWAESEVGEGVEEVWERSWNSAGRFVSTICDGDASRFFSALLRLHETLPTGQRLADKDISPSPDVLYSLGDLTSALSFAGHSPTLSCDNATLTTVSWPLHVRGALDGFEAAPTPPSVSQLGNCPADGIIYPITQGQVARAQVEDDDEWKIHPKMRPITLSHDEALQVPYPSPTAEKKAGKLSFFKGNDARRNPGEHDQGTYSRDEL